VLDGYRYTEDSVNRLFHKDILGRANCYDLPPVQKEQSVAILGGQVKVVEYGENRHPGLAVQPDDQVEQGQLVPQVEVVCRLVQQEQAGILGQAHRKIRPLPFASAQFGDRSVDQVQDIGMCHRKSDNFQIPFRFTSDPRDVRRPSHQDNLLDCEGQVHGEVLRQACHGPCKLTPGDQLQGAALESNLARLREQRAGCNSQEGRLTASIRPDDADELALRNLHRHVPQSECAAVAGADVVKREHVSSRKMTSFVEAETGRTDRQAAT
jgi:hypothetical protein